MHFYNYNHKNDFTKKNKEHYAYPLPLLNSSSFAATFIVSPNRQYCGETLPTRPAIIDPKN